MNGREHELMVWAVALYAALGWSGKEIARKIGRVRGGVARMITEARAKGYLVTAFNAANAPWEELQRVLLTVNTTDDHPIAEVLGDKKRMAELSKESFVETLRARTGAARNLRRVIVCESGGTKGELEQAEKVKLSE